MIGVRNVPKVGSNPQKQGFKFFLQITVPLEKASSVDLRTKSRLIIRALKDFYGNTENKEGGSN